MDLRTRRRFAWRTAVGSWAAWLAVLALGLVCSAPGLSAQDLMLDPSDDGDDLLEEIGSADWWHRDWKFRRRIVLEGPGLLLAEQGVLFFQEPDPLLLYNTGRCQDGLADLRIVGTMGKALPSGVINFPRDDGTCYLWCRINDEPIGAQLKLCLYYGNPKAKPTGNVLPKGVLPRGEIRVVAQREEAGEGAQLPKSPPAGSFHGAVRALEAEHFKGPKNEYAKGLIRLGSSEAASCGQFLRVPDKEPLTYHAAVRLPQAGAWQVHVRYKNGSRPFDLILGDDALPVKTKEARGAAFLWHSQQAELPEGEMKAALRLSQGAVVDCVLFSKNANYKPDYRDVTGPVWMRFRLVGESEQRFYARLYCVHTPYSADGPLGDVACYLLRDRSAVTDKDLEFVEKAGEETAFAKVGEWTGWGQALHSAAYTWHTTVSFVPVGGSAAQLKGLPVAFEFSSRPDASRVFNSGTEEPDRGGRIQVRMPTRLDYGALGMTESFGQWARRRFQMAADLGFQANEGPKVIAAGTMCDYPGSLEELEFMLKTFDWIGMNMIEMHWPDQEQLAALCEENHLRYAYGHTRASYMLTAKGEVRPGETHIEAVKRNLQTCAERLYPVPEKLPYYGGPWFMPHLCFTDLADEIGPAVCSVNISGHEHYKIEGDPFWKAVFVEYLQGQGLTPEFFGVKTWDDLKAVDYFKFHPKTEEKLAVAKESREAQEDAAKHLKELTALAGEEETQDIEEQAKDAEDLAAPFKEPEPEEEDTGPDVFEKRIYYHTQKFRSWYTALHWAAVTNAIEKNWRPGIKACVNLQAMPAQLGQMWDGALNVFDLGRMRAFNTLEVEDWTGSHVNVAFAMGLLKAAARKNELDLAALIVGHNTKKRIIANLSQKVHILVFYLYGPVHRIGPVWAEHPPSLCQIGEALRMTARCEPDLLASDNRPCDAAILVANTSEMHAAYGSWGFARERLALYHALLAAHVPVEIVGEEEIIEDNALARYRVLYVGESHVDSRAQEKIKEWVRGGGTLWASYSGLIRKEYDEDSRLFDEVFGLASRGEVAPVAERGKEVPVWRIRAAAGSERLPLRGFESHGEKPQYQLSTGKALASFEDDSPAVVANAFGKGHAFLCGFRLSGTRASAEKEEDPVGSLREARVALVRAAADAAKVRPHVTVDVPALRTWVHDGPEQTVVFLINDSGAAIEDAPMEVFLPRAATSAYSGRTGALQVEPKEGSAVVKLNIPQDDCDIIVLK